MQEEQNGTPSKYSLLWIVVILLSLVFVWNYLERISKLVTVQSQIAELESSIDWAKRWNLQLKDELRYYASPEYVEEMARSELGYVQPGDNVLIVLEAEGSEAPAAVTEAPAAPIEEEAPSFPSLAWWRAQFEAWGRAR